MQCCFCGYNNFSRDKICDKCKAHMPADRIIERITITEQPDESVKVEHEKRVELSEFPFRSDAEKAEDKQCMVVEIKRFRSVVSVLINEKCVRVSAAHEDAGCSAKYGLVKKAELWNVSGTTT